MCWSSATALINMYECKWACSLPKKSTQSITVAYLNFCSWTLKHSPFSYSYQQVTVYSTYKTAVTFQFSEMFTNANDEKMGLIACSWDNCETIGWKCLRERSMDHFRFWWTQMPQMSVCSVLLSFWQTFSETCCTHQNSYEHWII